jgi:alpha-tubulin suppressor-like RCC1 family protein
VDGKAVCWGDNDHGQSTPPQAAFTSIGAGLQHTCGVTKDGSLLCWGDNEYRQCNCGESYWPPIGP